MRFFQPFSGRRPDPSRPAMRPAAGRAGTTLVELLLFMVILGIMGALLLPILFAATEDRLLQQTVSTVEQNGVQLLQTIAYQVRHAERIVGPDATTTGTMTGTILTLQSGSGGTNPTIIGLVSGAIIMIQGTAKQTVTSSQVAVESFFVRNTSASATKQSVFVRFRLSRTIRLQAPRSYRQNFEAAFALPPDDVVTGDSCHCAVPGCGGPNMYVWQVCSNTVCQTAQTQLQCP